MKSNLTKKDYKNLLDESSELKPSYRKIKINKLHGIIECLTIKLENMFDYDLVYRNLKYGFKIHLNNITMKTYEKLVTKERITIDDKDYYAANNSFNFKTGKVSIDLIGYKLYEKPID